VELPHEADALAHRARPAAHVDAVDRGAATFNVRCTGLF
jgi:hypothetical protein